MRALTRPENRSWRVLLLAVQLNILCMNVLHAQDTQKSTVQLSDKDWKAVEGIFQNPQNSDVNVQFVAKGGLLIARLLWNNNEIRLSPESPLHFSSLQNGNEEEVQITFVRDSAGGVNQVSVQNNGVWNRVKNYKPIVKKEIALSPRQLKPFEGLYQLGQEGTQFITISAKENGLELKQEWDGNVMIFVPDSPTAFFRKEAPLFTLSFSEDVNGNVTQMLAFKKDLWVKTKKPLLTAADLKKFEGRYQSSDDTDNVIELTVRGNQLIAKQLWDKKEISLEPRTDRYFYNRSESFPLVVIKDGDGKVTGIMVLGNENFKKIN